MKKEICKKISLSKVKVPKMETYLDDTVACQRR